MHGPHIYTTPVISPKNQMRTIQRFKTVYTCIGRACTQLLSYYEKTNTHHSALWYRIGHTYTQLLSYYEKNERRQFSALKSCIHALAAHIHNSCHIMKKKLQNNQHFQTVYTCFGPTYTQLLSYYKKNKRRPTSTFKQCLHTCAAYIHMGSVTMA
jgi:hypothetical protein